MYRVLNKVVLLQRFYFQKSELEKILLLSALFSLSLSFTRVLYTGEWLFLSLIWNLFLAFVPYVISKSLLQNIQWIENSWKFAVVLVVWLLFIPNSFYIITDLFHLKKRMDIPLWFDLALIFSFAWNGLLLGILSVRQVEKAVQARWQLRNEWLFVLPVMWLNAFGIYLGRYLRYNSWDVVSKPYSLTQDILYLIMHPIRKRFDWGMIFCYAVLMSIVYLTIKKLIAGKES